MALDNGFEGNQMTDEQIAAVNAKGPPPPPDYANLAWAAPRSLFPLRALALCRL